MSQPLGKQRRPKQPKQPPRPRWIEYCPVCGEVGKVVGTVPWKDRLSKRVYRWACEECVRRRVLFRADGPPPAEERERDES